MEKYLFGKAEDEAHKIKGKLESGEASDYDEAEKIVEQDKKDKNFDFTKGEDRERFENLPEDKRESLISGAESMATDENKLMDKTKNERIENHKKYGQYKDFVYEVIAEIFQEKGLLKKTNVWKKKILRFHKLPPEVVFIFDKLKAENISADDVPRGILKDVLSKAYDLIDRHNEYDKDLAQRVSHSEVLRWRNNEKLQNEDSFYKIVATLRDHAVVKTPKTKIGQKPRVTFQPKGAYHKKQSLK